MRFCTEKPLSQSTELRGITLLIAINFVSFGYSVCFVEIMSSPREADVYLPSDFSAFSFFLQTWFLNKDHSCLAMSIWTGGGSFPLFSPK